MKNIRILIRDLNEACIALGEVKVVAAGVMYATIECSAAMCQTLTEARIDWSFD